MIVNFIIVFLMVIVALYIWGYFNDIKINWFEKRTIIIIIAATIITLGNYYNSNALFKLINMTLIFVFTYKLLFRVKLKQSIVGPVILEFLYVICETVFFMIMMAVHKETIEIFMENYAENIVTNITISLMVIFVAKISFVKKLYLYFSRIINRFDEINVIALLFLAIFVYGVYTANVYYDVDSTLLMFISLTISLISFGLVAAFFKTKDNYYKIYNKYNDSLLSLKEFEAMLNNYRIENHENKNQLLTIRNMTKNKKVISFIDAILTNKIKDNDGLMHETSVIPSGGLRGLIYSKMLVMAQKNIECELDVAREIRTINMLQYGDNLILDICKIVGIFLDNAIEEVDLLEEKYIIIEMFMDEKILNITITNIFDTNISKDNIYDIGYSTKGENHGYGLSLVNKIVSRNKHLKTHHEINDDEFTQILEVYK